LVYIARDQVAIYEIYTAAKKEPSASKGNMTQNTSFYVIHYLKMILTYLLTYGVEPFLSSW
jgi:hypothetical protein